MFGWQREYKSTKKIAYEHYSRTSLVPRPSSKEGKRRAEGGSGLETQTWATGSENQWTSNMLDHVVNNQHKAAMPHLYTAQARVSNVTSYAPIVHSLLKEEE